MTLPTATIEDLYEIGKSDRPDEVLLHSPDATSAAVVVRTYLDTPYSNHLLAAVVSGAIKQMSFAYVIPKGKSEQTGEEIKGGKLTTRVIREVKQFDTSDVRWGANGATTELATCNSLAVIPTSCAMSRQMRAKVCLSTSASQGLEKYWCERRSLPTRVMDKWQGR